ncbi:MAG: hypothetical protein AB8G26_14385 [Ilumatobacter sp.]
MAETSAFHEGVATRTQPTATAHRRSDPNSIVAIFGASSDRARLGCAVIAAFLAGAASNGTVSWATTVTIVVLLPVLLMGQRRTTLPPSLITSAAVIGFFTWVATAEPSAPRPLGAILLGAALTAAPLAVAQFTVPSARGATETKLAAVLGGALGIVEPTAGLVAISIAATLTVAASLVRRRPVTVFAPGMVAGAVGVVASLAWL